MALSTMTFVVFSTEAIAQPFWLDTEQLHEGVVSKQCGFPLFGLVVQTFYQSIGFRFP